MNQKTILITGGVGYLGMHCAWLLARQNYNIITLDQASIKKPSPLPWATCISGDYADEKIVTQIFKQHSIDTVIHLAALSCAHQSVTQPLNVYQNNVSKTIRLLALMIDHDIKNIIFSSSSDVYGIPESANPLTEEYLVHPVTPLGRTKLILEHMIKDAADAYGTQYVVLRFSPFAGRHPELSPHTCIPHGLIDSMLNAVRTKQPFVIPGTSYQTSDGTYIRDYLHVIDGAQAIVHALEHLQRKNPPDTFNISTGTGYSVKQIITTVEELLNTQLTVTYGIMPQHEPAKRVLDPSRAQTILGWEARQSKLENIVQSVIKPF